MQPQRTLRTQRTQKRAQCIFYFVLIFVSLCSLCPLWQIVSAELPTTRPYEAVTFAPESRTDPPQKIFTVSIDLTHRNVQVAVAPSGSDPDGPDGKWQTTLDETADVAQRENFDIAINGDFFSVETVIDPQTGKKRGYHEGQSALVIGPAMTDGKLWATSEKPRPCLIITRERRARIAEPRSLPPDARQVMAGSHIIVKQAKKAALPDTAFSTTRHPRTAVGTADGGRRLILVVVDGRRPGTSVGMSLDELAELMLKLGCQDALNLDGGGSSTLVMRNRDTGELRVLNQPSDGKQRAVANVLGVRLTSSSPPSSDEGHESQKRDRR